MKNTVVIFCFCLTLVSLSAKGQMLDTTMLCPVNHTNPSHDTVKTISNHYTRGGCIHTIICKDAPIDIDAVFNTTYKATYTRDFFIHHP
jgi:hypothetical protein